MGSPFALRSGGRRSAPAPGTGREDHPIVVPIGQEYLAQGRGDPDALLRFRSGHGTRGGADTRQEGQRVLNRIVTLPRDIVEGNTGCAFGTPSRLFEPIGNLIAIGKGERPRLISFDRVGRDADRLYGGVPRPDMAQHLRQVAWPEAQILQRRHVPAGETVGYNATWTAPADTEVAILNLGYADGYRRALSGLGAAVVDGVKLPVLGRVSMDLLAINVTARADLAEGDWLSMDYDLAAASAASGVSQYELLTGLAQRFARG